MTAAAAVLHLTLANLKPGLSESEVEGLIGAFGGLGDLPGVIHLGAVRARDESSTHTLALYTYLSDAAGLEDFGTDSRHIEFLRGSLMGAVTDLATAGVAASALPPERYSAAACFAASFKPRVFDWQVRELQRSVAGPLPVSGGAALDDRQRFRTAGLVFWPGDGPPADGSFEGFGERWDSACGDILAESALVLGEARALTAPAYLGEKRS